MLVSQTDVLSQLMKKSAEDLLAGPISKLTLLIRDKQQLRKNYTDQWNLLKQELNKVGDLRPPMQHTITDLQAVVPSGGGRCLALLP